MAELVDIAGDGLPRHIWATFARAGQAAMGVGVERARNGLGGFAFRNTLVREVDGSRVDRSRGRRLAGGLLLLAELLERGDGAAAGLGVVHDRRRVVGRGAIVVGHP